MEIYIIIEIIYGIDFSINVYPCATLGLARVLKENMIKDKLLDYKDVEYESFEDDNTILLKTKDNEVIYSLKIETSKTINNIGKVEEIIYQKRKNNK